MYTQEAVLEKLFKRTTHGIRFGLDRITQAAKELGNPHHTFKSIHVAGTNGKGSVCAFLESVLRSQGYTTGLFTSPHIVRFEERFIVNGACVHSEEWLDVYRDIEGLVDRYELTFFEISALIAFELFKRQKVDWAVIETGLGGRLDATNIILPEVSVITSIDIDHIEYLGNDIISIAKEKLGIVKEQVPLVLSVQNSREVIELAQDICAERKSRCVVVQKGDAVDITEDNDGVSFYYRNIPVKVPLHGHYQVVNALCALKTIEVLKLSAGEISIEGIGATVLPGRFQRFHIRGKDIIFDVAHNPQAVEQLCRQIMHRFPKIPVCIVAGIMREKDAREIVLHYLSCAKVLIVTRPNTSRAAEPSFLMSVIPKDVTGEVIVKETVKEAVDYACEEFDGIICITGSFYTVGEAMAILGIEPYPE